MKKVPDSHKTAVPAIVMVEDEDVRMLDEDNIWSTEKYENDLFLVKRKEDPLTIRMKMYFNSSIPKDMDHYQLKRFCLKRMEANMVLFRKGSCVTCMALLGYTLWHQIPGNLRRQVSKEFKIAIAEKKIRGIIFLLNPDDNKPVKQNGSQLYKIIRHPAKMPSS